MASTATALRPTRRPARHPRKAARDMGIAVKQPANAIDVYSECRALGHDWNHLGAPDITWHPTPLGVYGWHSSCRTCGTERVKWLQRNGLSAGVRYRYPEDYQSRGENKLDREDWGKLFIRTHLGGK